MAFGSVAGTAACSEKMKKNKRLPCRFSGRFPVFPVAALRRKRNGAAATFVYLVRVATNATDGIPVTTLGFPAVYPAGRAVRDQRERRVWSVGVWRGFVLVC